MRRISIPEKLQDFIEDDGSEDTAFDIPLSEIFYNLIQEYFRGPSGDKDKKPKAFSSNVHSKHSKFQELAEDINVWNESENQKYWNEYAYNREKKVVKIFIKREYLRSLCFPDPKQKTQKKFKFSIVLIFMYLDFHLEKNGLRDATYWIENSKKKNKLQFQESNNRKSSYNSEIDINGTRHINILFKNKILSSTRVYNPKDFYLAKDIDECQWYGVFYNNGWDIRRENYSQIKEQILQSFQTNKSYNISAIIHGHGGCGKSTFFRRLAADLINNDLFVLWVLNVTTLYKNLIKIKEDINHNYLLIIEDWEKIKGIQEIVRDFLSETLELTNVRIVIGDRETINKEYIEYFNEDNFFQLTSKENETIIEEILIINPQWIMASAIVLSKKEFYYSPLYIILFVIGRTYGYKCEGALQVRQENDIETQFKSIVRNDIKRIKESYPGLAFALFCWSHIFNEYKSKKPIILWTAFLKIADYYNKNFEVSKRFAKINKNDPIGEILSFYISLKTHFAPTPLTNVEVFYFHHDLLPELGLSQKIETNWFFDDTIKIELLKVLANRKEISTLFTMVYLFGIRESERVEFKEIRSRLRIRSRHKIIFFYFHNIFLRLFCSVNNPRFSDRFWLKTIGFIRLLASASFYDQQAIDAILKKIIDKGCKAKCVKAAYKANLISKDDFLTFALPSPANSGNPFEFIYLQFVFEPFVGFFQFYDIMAFEH